MKKTIKLSYDTYAESPREWDNLGTLALHPNYTSDAPIEDFNEYLCELLGMDIEMCEKWANGDVYAFTIEDENGDVEDSCGGFYSIEEMTDCIDASDFDMTDDELKSHLLSLDVKY